MNLRTLSAAAPHAALPRLLLALLMVTGCFGDFEPESHAFCRTNADCIAGWVCDGVRQQCVKVGSDVSGVDAGGDAPDPTPDTSGTDTAATDVPLGPDLLVDDTGPDTAAAPDLWEPDDTGALDDAGPLEDASGTDGTDGVDVPDSSADLTEPTDEGPTSDVEGADAPPESDASDDVSPPDVGCVDECPIEGHLYCTAQASELSPCVQLDGCLKLGPPIVCQFAVSCPAPCGDAPCEATGACIFGEECVAAGTIDETGCAVCSSAPGGQKVPRACDDGDPCTVDACDGACTNTPASGPPCDDGDACTVEDQCVSGACGGSEVDCGEGNVCAASACHVVQGVATCAPVYAPDTTACDDGNPCTDLDRCGTGATAGSCVGSSTAASCDDGDACTDDACVANTCVSTPRSCDDGQDCTTDGCEGGACQSIARQGTCSDGNACTAEDACAAGQCAGQKRDCDDGNPCTADSCAPASGCQHDPKAGPCSDGLSCTLDDSCSGGVCKGTLFPCSDVGCRTTICTELGQGLKVCALAGNSAQGKACDDGLSCTTDDACDGAGGCSGPVQAGSCAIDGACFVHNQTDPKGPCRLCKSTSPTAWTFKAELLACDDGDACTTTSACSQGSCAQTGTLSCDDQNACTVDSCSPLSGCVHSAAANLTACDRDGLSCTTDRCIGGQCTFANVSVGTCFIDGACHEVDATPSGPDADCLACDPFTNPLGWTPIPFLVGQACSSNPCRSGATCSAEGRCEGGNGHSGSSCPDGVCLSGDCWLQYPALAGPQGDRGYSFTVPGGCFELDVRVAGAGGGEGGYGGTIGGRLIVSPGDIIAMWVGAGGGLGTAGLAGAGGAGTVRGGDGGSVPDGTGIGGNGGGAASLVHHKGQMVLVGGGGGGAAFYQAGGGPGGQWPSLAGNNGGSPYPLSAGAGQGGPSSGGVAPVGGLGKSGGGAGQPAGEAGGAGGAGTGSYAKGGGGGGGGYRWGGSGGGGWGGGGAADSGGGGGGGGASYFHTSVTSPLNWSPPIGYSRTSSSNPGQPGLVLLRCEPPTTAGCGSAGTPDGTACDDGNPCTTSDSCLDGTCKPGPIVACPSPESCREPGACVSATGTCEYPVAPPGSICDDGNPCSQEDACDESGQCQPGPHINCVAPNSCHLAVACDPNTGNCPAATLVTNGTPCSDDSACTLNDACVAGMCLGAERTCDDGNPCTVDACSPQSGCTSTNADATTPCDDALSCTTGTTCDGSGSCKGVLEAGKCLIAGTCYSNNAPNPLNGCQICKVASGAAQWTLLADTVSCDDSNVCTTSSKCVAGTCTSVATITCDDQKPCTDDVCHPVAGCQFTSDDSNLCDLDGKACTADACVSGTCNAGAISPLTCLIGGVCYPIDAGRGAPHDSCAICDPFASQTAWTTQNEGQPCNTCRTGATCQQGLCKGGAASSAANGAVCAPSTGVWTYQCSEGDCWAWAPKSSGATAQSWSVPNGCAQATALVWGAGGGSGGQKAGNPAGAGGNGGGGGFAGGSFPVSPGESLAVYIGSPGQRGTGSLQGGLPGGGPGGYTGTSCSGGGGGGFSAVLRGSSHLLVAGGGGGGSSGTDGGPTVDAGGSGGGSSGQAGQLPQFSGGGATATAGGLGGMKALGVGDYYEGYFVGGSGGKLLGGAGHVHGALGACSGGGGGGGWYGGGGGATWIGAVSDKLGGGGGGGSGYTDAGLTAGTAKLVSGSFKTPAEPDTAHPNQLDRFEGYSVAFGEIRRRARSDGPGLVLLRCEKQAGE